MLNELEQFKEDTAMSLFGRSRRLAIAGNQCVKCGFPHNLRSDFRDALSYKEYGISGFCQSCQDDIFGTDSGCAQDKEATLNVAHEFLDMMPDSMEFYDDYNDMGWKD